MSRPEQGSAEDKCYTPLNQCFRKMMNFILNMLYQSKEPDRMKKMLADLAGDFNQL